MRFSVWTAMALATKPVDGLDSSRDGEETIRLIGKLHDPAYFGEMSGADQMAELLEDHFVGMVGSGMPADELEKISDAVELWGETLGTRALDAVNSAIVGEFEHVEEYISGIDSESTLEDHAATLRKLAARISIPSGIAERAIEHVEERKAWLEKEISKSESPSVSPAAGRDTDEFNDEELRNLFAPLLQREE
jgi:hypothetical protein